MDFEKKIKRLEEIVTSMEGGEVSLELSLKLFEEGVTLTKECHQQLAAAEQKVKILLNIDNDGKILTEDFSS